MLLRPRASKVSRRSRRGETCDCWRVSCCCEATERSAVDDLVRDTSRSPSYRPTRTPASPGGLRTEAYLRKTTESFKVTQKSTGTSK